MSRADSMPTLLLVAACLAIVGGLAVLVLGGATRDVDTAITDAVRASSLRESLAPLRVITEAGSTWAVTVLAGVALILGFLGGPWRHGVIAAAVIGLTSLANSTMKLLVARERPELVDAIVTETGYSFPSGHAALGMAGWGVIAVLLWRSRLPRPGRIALVVAIGALVILIGLSRIYLGVHYPTDVLAGWAGGSVVVIVYERITRTVSRGPAAAVVGEDRGARRSDPPATG